MSTSSALVIEPVASWWRLQQSSEFFFKDLDTQMKEHHRHLVWFFMGLVGSAPAFSRVVATFNGDSFEFDDIAYAQVVPEPSAGILVGAGLFIFGLVRRKAA